MSEHIERMTGVLVDDWDTIKGWKHALSVDIVWEVDVETGDVRAVMCNGVALVPESEIFYSSRKVS